MELTELQNKNIETHRNVQRQARYSHKDWVEWYDRAGVMLAERKSREAIKKAMLASGTQGKFYIVRASRADRWLTSWRIGINILNHYKRGLIK